jgi:hypothetical protein
MDAWIGGKRTRRMLAMVRQASFTNALGAIGCETVLKQQLARSHPGRFSLARLGP